MPPVPRPRLCQQRGGTFYVRRQISNRCREKLDERLFAFDDLRDARAVQTYRFAYLSER